MRTASSKNQLENSTGKKFVCLWTVYCTVVAIVLAYWSLYASACGTGRISIEIIRRNCTWSNLARIMVDEPKKKPKSKLAKLPLGKPLSQLPLELPSNVQWWKRTWSWQNHRNNCHPHHHDHRKRKNKSFAHDRPMIFQKFSIVSWIRSMMKLPDGIVMELEFYSNCTIQNFPSYSKNIFSVSFVPDEMKCE